MSIMDFLGQNTGLEAPESPFPPQLAGLMGGAQAPPDVAGMGEPPVEPVEGEESTIDILMRMIEDAKLYIETESDEEDKLTMTKVLQTLQKYLADEQAERDDAMQGKASPRMMRKAYGG